MKKLLILFILFIGVIGCDSSESNNKDIMEVMKESEYIIVDVRTEKEYEEEHVVGAINIPVGLIDEEIELEKEKIIFVYCLSGGRSKIAYDKLKGLGYEVYDLGAFSEIDLPKE